MRYSIALIVLLATPSIGTAWECKSEAIASKFNDLLEITIQKAEVEGENLRILMISVPSKIDNVSISSIMLDQSNERGRLLSTRLSMEEEDGFSKSMSLMAPSQIEISSFRVFYMVTPVYPDACHYEYSVPIKHNQKLQPTAVAPAE